MCQWIELLSVDAKICFQCGKFQTSLLEISREKPLPISRIGDKWWPMGKLQGIKKASNAEMTRIRMVNQLEDHIKWLYENWVGDLMMKDFIERNQQPNVSKRTKVIETFVKLAGDKLERATELAEEIHRGGKTFERSLADSLEQLKVV